MNVRLIDTSIMLNLLGVPKRCNDKDQVQEELKKALQNNDTLILPVATIIETGNAIAQISGNKRHDIAEKFALYLSKTAEGNAPWSCDSTEVAREDLLYYANNYATSADAGVGMGDLSIIRTYEKCKESLVVGRIMIWSTDGHLSSYQESEVYNTRRKA